MQGTVVGTVVFKEAIEYLPEYLDSLMKQTDQNFSIMLVNDNILPRQLEEILAHYPKNFASRIVVIDKSKDKLQPYMLRVELLRQAWEQGYELLVIMDCDDKASASRISCIQEQFDMEYTFFYNELRDFAGEPVMPPLPEYTDNASAISESNYLGMSNGAINLKKISLKFICSLTEGQTRIFDWYFYTRLLLNGARGKKIQGCYTYYRIYAENIAGTSQCNKAALEKEIQIKRQHYHLLEHYNKQYEKLARYYEKLQIENIHPQPENGYWWSLIDSSKEEMIL